MESTITEKEFPVKLIWIFKISLYEAGMAIFVMLLFFFFPTFFSTDSGQTPSFIFIIIFVASIFILKSLIITTMAALHRHYFHFSLDEKVLTVRQGIISKEERKIPYLSMQNIFVEQDFTDRVLGISTLTIENLSYGGEFRPFNTTGSVSAKHNEFIGSVGSKVYIPGLVKLQAEALKELFLKKMKENPLRETGSGL